jgi:hypothetical protein
MKYATVAQSYTPKKTLVTSNNAEPQKNSASQLQEIRMAYETSCDLKKKNGNPQATSIPAAT